MNVLLCFAALLGVTLAGDSATIYAAPTYGHPHGGNFARGGYAPHRVFGFPGSDPRCHEDGDLVMDPDNRCQVYQCVMKEKKHGYDDKHVYKYFDVEGVACPTIKVPAYIQHPHHGYAHTAKDAAAPHAAGFPHQGFGHHGYGYGYKVHEIDIQTAVNKYNHAHYLSTHVKGEVKAVCGDYVYKPETECVDVKLH